MVILFMAGEIRILDKDGWFFEIFCWFGNKPTKLVNDFSFDLFRTRVQIPPSPFRYKLILSIWPVHARQPFLKETRI